MYNQSQQCGSGTETLRDKPTGQIESQQIFLDETIKRLQDSVSQLFSRLEPVLRPCAPADNGKNCPQAIEVFVAVAQRSNSQACSIQVINDSIIDLLKRLET